MMRSDKLGYNAPIKVYDRKFYKYEDENYSITNSPISNQDLSKLSEDEKQVVFERLIIQKSSLRSVTPA